MSFTAAATDLVDGAVGTSCAPASGALFPIGTTTVTCTAADHAGNTASGSFTVTVTGNGFDLSEYVVFSSEQTWLLKGSQVLKGDVGVNQALPNRSERRDGRFDLQIGENVRMMDGSRAVGDSVWLKGSSVWDVLFNDLRLPREGAIRGAQRTPVTLPRLTLPALPSSITVGTQDVEVGRNGSRTLAAGPYRKITVLRGGTLVLTGGVVQAALDVREDAKVLFRSAGELWIQKEMDTDTQVYLGSDPSVSGLSAKDVKVVVAGTNDRGRRHGDDDGPAEEVSPTAVQIGQRNVVRASVYAPNGTVWLKKGVEAAGAFIGKKARIGQDVTLSLESAY